MVIPPVTADTTPPTISITSTPAAVTNLNYATFKFSASETVTYQFSIDGSSWISSTDPEIALLGIPDGQHFIAVKAVDAAGNTSAVSSYAWMIDATIPTVSFTSKPAALTNLTDATFNLSSSETVTYSYRVDGGSWISAAAGDIALTGLANGQHSIEVKGTDAAGSESSALTYAWMIDTTVPTVSFTSKPAALTNLKDATFDLSSSATLTYSYRVDGSSWISAAGSVIALTGLADGSHSIEVQGVDAAGNTSAISTYAWMIDTTIPTVSFTSKPAAVTNLSNATFNLSSGETVTYSYRVDGGSWISAAGSAIALTGLTDGQHSIEVKGVDAAGNMSAISSYAWKIETVLPIITMTSTPPAATA